MKQNICAYYNYQGCGVTKRETTDDEETETRKKIDSVPLIVPGHNHRNQCLARWGGLGDDALARVHSRQGGGVMACN